MRVFAIAAFLFGSMAPLGAISVASAQEEGPIVSVPEATIPNFDAQHVGPILDELGAAWRVRQTNDGQSLIDVNFGGEVNFVMMPVVCRSTLSGAGQSVSGQAAAGPSDCVGLSMAALFEGAANMQTVQAFNYRYAFAKAGLNPNGGAYLTRYEIADYGVPRGNLASSMLVFAQQAELFAEALSSVRQTVSQQGYAEDLAAGKLNRSNLESFSGVVVAPATGIEAHGEALDDVGAMLSTIFDDDDAPRNKLRNLNAQKN